MWQSKQNLYIQRKVCFSLDFHSSKYSGIINKSNISYLTWEPAKSHHSIKETLFFLFFFFFIYLRFSWWLGFVWPDSNLVTSAWQWNERRSLTCIKKRLIFMFSALFFQESTSTPMHHIYFIRRKWERGKKNCSLNSHTHTHTHTHTPAQTHPSSLWEGLSTGVWTNWYSPTMPRASPRNHSAVLLTAHIPSLLQT